MSKLVIDGMNRLNGELKVQGAKNSSLPILAATLLIKAKSIIHNCPKLSDVSAAIKILEYLGCIVIREGNTVTVDASNVNRYDIPENLMREMRSSIVFLGAIIGRMSKAKLSTPGGCELGPRPIDLHLAALQKLGVDIEDEYGYLNCDVKNGLSAKKISLTFPSVGATENIILAAVLANGVTIITNAAQEPEIVDLSNFLNKCGAKIKGAGESIVVIEGVKHLHSCEHTVMPDRIVTATYMSCATITGGEILLKDVNANHIDSIIPIFEQMGSQIKCTDDTIHIVAPKQIKGVKDIKTMPYPGFPTDAQAEIMAVLTKSDGMSVFVENIFSNRYKHVGELNRLGAKIIVEDRVAIVKGVSALTGTNVCAMDLRGGAALVIAGLAAEGSTIIDDIYHIDRGYEEIENRLTQIGAKIKRS